MIAEMETSLAELIAKRRTKRTLQPYRAAVTAEIIETLRKFFSNEMPGFTVSDVSRVGGGASKEQFFFSLTSESGSCDKYILRMDPQMAITETGRDREYEILKAMKGIVPVPDPAWIDRDGTHFGQPAVIMRAVSGVTKPSNSSLKVSGLGINLGQRLRKLIKPQFVNHLAAIHGYDWEKKPIAGMEVPDADDKQCARWAFNYWRELWRLDEGEARPIISLVENWLENNMPDTTELVLTHGDYRTGNYLFDEETGEITALLDWELARIGDFHEDLAWVLMLIFGTHENGKFRASDLYGYEEFLSAYERVSGRTVDRDVLYYYEVMSSWKCLIIVGCNGMAAARGQHNHQDVLLTFLASTHVMFASDLVRLLSRRIAS